MANELNIFLSSSQTGLTMVAKIMLGGSQVGATISLTESGTKAGYYYGNAPASIANGSYGIVFETNAGVTKGSGNIEFYNDVEVTGFIDTEKVTDLWKIEGLELGNPMTVTPIKRSTSDIDLTLTGDGINTTTVTRN